jgi:glycine/D-amino acid oxidase-like deaminating enzyme
VPGELPRRSPWIEQLDRERARHPLAHDLVTDIAVIGAGIAGISTAFFLLRDTDARVALIERDRAGHGATGHNAGQLTTYFERPLQELVDEYGFDRAIDAQRGLDQAWGLLETMLAESGATAPIDRFTGHMGMFTLDHLMVHLRTIRLRQQGGLESPTCIVAEDAPFLAMIPDEFADLYSVVPADQVRTLLGTGDPRYCAATSDRKGCANGALVVQQVLDHLLQRYPERLTFAEETAVDRVRLGQDAAVVFARGHRVETSRVVMCTNGFVDHVIENSAGDAIDPRMQHRVAGDVGYMVGFIEPAVTLPAATSFIRNELIGGDIPYVYVTTRAYESTRAAGALTCIGGPEVMLEDTDVYDPTAGFPVAVIDEIDRDVLPIVCPDRPPGSPYDYSWHGLMAYTESRVRLIGFEPRNPVLMYNLGCNGVGFLPSIFGGHRIASLVGDHPPPPSIFDPT